MWVCLYGYYTIPVSSLFPFMLSCHLGKSNTASYLGFLCSKISTVTNRVSAKRKNSCISN